MQTLDRDEVVGHVPATPQEVYAVVADVTRMPELSPEVTQARWLDGATGPVVGARFEAVNDVGRGRPWRNRPEVVAAEPGVEFAFARTEKLTGTIVWRYRFEADGGGTRVTESYEVTRPVSRIGWFVIERMYGRRDRRADLRAGMERTLDNLRAVFEVRATG